MDGKEITVVEDEVQRDSENCCVEEHISVQRFHCFTAVVAEKQQFLNTLRVPLKLM